MLKLRTDHWWYTYKKTWPEDFLLIVLFALLQFRGCVLTSSHILVRMTVGLGYSIFTYLTTKTCTENRLWKYDAHNMLPVWGLQYAAKVGGSNRNTDYWPSSGFLLESQREHQSSTQTRHSKGDITFLSSVYLTSKQRATRMRKKTFTLLHSLVRRFMKPEKCVLKILPFTT